MIGGTTYATFGKAREEKNQGGGEGQIGNTLGTLLGTGGEQKC